jgi:hypothetical protein
MELWTIWFLRVLGAAGSYMRKWKLNGYITPTGRDDFFRKDTEEEILLPYHLNFSVFSVVIYITYKPIVGFEIWFDCLPKIK